MTSTFGRASTRHGVGADRARKISDAEASKRGFARGMSEAGEREARSNDQIGSGADSIRDIPHRATPVSKPGPGRR